MTNVEQNVIALLTELSTAFVDVVVKDGLVVFNKMVVVKLVIFLKSDMFISQMLISYF